MDYDGYEDLSFKPNIAIDQESETSKSKVSDSPSFLGDSKLIMAELPGDSQLNSVARNFDLNYRPYETRDYDYVRIPKEENLLNVDTENFDEFERVYNCTRAELIHLSKCFS